MSEDDTPGRGEFTVGSQIAGYRLEEQIGRGGMAIVYRALDVRLDRHVALKILAPGLAIDDAFRQRFIRESRAAAAVDHPHIIPVFDAGEANGVLFIAMRYVHGGDVRMLLDAGGPLPAARAADIVTQVAAALDAAHAHGLVHRDVKPGNMLLDSTSGGGRQDHVYLSDFGLSKQSLAVTGLTSTGQFLGTLDYVAPEQIEGRPVDGRADLYALACASFEMLCGSPPFRRDQGLAVVWAQLSERPPSLCARRADLPTAVDAVLTRAMAKAPGDRYPTCLAFATALREALGLEGPGSPGTSSPGAGRPVAGTPGGPGEPRAHPPTEISMPGTGRAGAAGGGVPGPEPGAGAGAGLEARAGAATDWAAGQPGGPREGGASWEPGGPPTEARRVPRAAKPGLTEPPGAYPPSGLAGYPSSGRAAYPPSQGQGGYAPSGRQGGGYPPGGQGGYPQQGYGSQQRRPWWRSPAAVIIACVIVIGAAGGAYALRGGHGSGGTDGKTGTVVSMPGCTAAVASAASLSKVRTAMTKTGGGPFAVNVTADGKYSFVTLGDSIALLSNGVTLAPTLIRTFSAPGAKHGAALTSDGRYLVAAANSGAIVISVPAAEQGSSNPIVGTLTSTYGSGAVEVAISPGGKFAFVTLQNSADMVVFNLASALSSGFGPSDVVGEINLGQQPVGMVISPDGKWLYVTSMSRTKTVSPSEGTITVLDLHRAEVKPSSSIVSTATAGCSPVRLITSAAGSDVWATSRESDTLLGFSAVRLRTDPAHALIARVNVGAAPIGMIMVNNSSRILIANSNVHNQPGATASLAVISVPAALAHGQALLGVIKTGLVPREFGLERGGRTVLLADNGSGQVQAIDVGSLP